MPSTRLSPFFSHLSWIGPYLQECCLNDAGMARQIATADTARWQLIALFALKSDVLSPAQAAPLIARAPFREAMEALTGVNVRGARGILMRFVPELPHLRLDAADLLAVLSDERMIRALRGLRSLEHGQLRPLVLLPRGHDWTGLMTSIGHCLVSRNAVSTVARLMAANEQDALKLEALQAVKSRGQLRSLIRSFLEQRGFPAPPWTGDDRLVPITTAADLARLGKRYGLCLQIYAQDCMSGERVFYTLKDPFCAIELIRLGDGWRVGQIRAANNARLVQPMLDFVEASLAANIEGLAIRSNYQAPGDELDDMLSLSSFAYP